MVNPYMGMLLSEGSCLGKFSGMRQITEIETLNDDMLPRDRRERGELQYFKYRIIV